MKGLRPLKASASRNFSVDEHGIPMPEIEPEDALHEEDELEGGGGEVAAKRAVLARHGIEPYRLRAVPKPGAKLSEVVKSHMAEEEFDELGYPRVGQDFVERAVAEHELARSDPRVNPNLLHEENEQMYWWNVQRTAFGKAVLRSEQHWTKRRNVWLRQYEAVELGNVQREQLMEMLEGCSMEVKRLMTPIMRYRIAEVALGEMHRKAKAERVPLRELLEHPDELAVLRGLRRRIDAGGPEVAGELMDEYDFRQRVVVFDKQSAIDHAPVERVTTDVETMVRCLNMGQKYKKDGDLEWAKGEAQEAVAAWRMADSFLKRYRIDEASGNQIAAEIHAGVLRNLALGAMRLESWTEALMAADDALRIDEDDHKSWYRRACALEGLGRLEEAGEALRQVELAAVGRHDRDRIERDTQARRDKLESLQQRDDERQRKGMVRALAGGVFSEDREQPRALVDQGESLEDAELGEPPEAPAAEPALADGAAPREAAAPRVRLTKDGAAELLEEMLRLFSETRFQAQVAKLAVDMRGETPLFLENLRKVRLEAQRPLLAKWGFHATLGGLEAMQAALGEHVTGQSGADAALAEKWARVLGAQLGPMYEKVREYHQVNDARAAACRAHEAAAIAGDAHGDTDESDLELEELT